MTRRAWLALLSMLLAACGSASPDEPQAETTTSSTVTTTAVTTTSGEVAAPSTPPGGGSPPTAATRQPGSAQPSPPSTGATVAATAAPACAVPARAEPRADRPRYELKVDVRLAENAVVGDVAVRFTPDRATDRIVLRLWPNGPRIARAGGRLDVGTLRVDGRTVPARLENPTTLVARPEDGVAAGRTVLVTLPWRLTLPGNIPDRISRSGDSVRLGSFFPILPWEPGFGWSTDPPTGAFAEASMAPTADFDMHVTLPPGLTALTGGRYTGGGRFEVRAARDVALSVGRFALAGRTVHVPHAVEITVGVAAGIRESPAAYLDKASRVIGDFSRRYGSYPWPTYSLAITPGLRGGIEYPMHVMQGPATLGRTTSHEIGHMWFFGLVGGNQGRDPWLDEGLATFAEARYEGTLGSVKARTIPADARGRAGEPMTYWESRQSSYYLGVYVQGAQALAALGAPDRVDCALRAFAARSAHAIARNQDLVAAFEPVFPDVRNVLARYGIRG